MSVRQVLIDGKTDSTLDKEENKEVDRNLLQLAIEKRIKNLTQNDLHLGVLLSLSRQKIHGKNPVSVEDVIILGENDDNSVWITFPFCLPNYGWSQQIGIIFKNEDGSIEVAINYNDRLPFLDGKIIWRSSVKNPDVYKEFEKIAQYLLEKYGIDSFLNILKEEKDRLENKQ
jgi:hypothetical protein